MNATNTKPKVRPTEIADAVACSEVLCASIRELCTDDHQGNEQIIGQWLENKTPATLQSWIESPEATIYVAEVDGRIAAVGGLSGPEITLNYVSPSFRSMGVSTAMLEALESELVASGFRSGQLTSTATAHDFYRGAGWTDSGEPVESMGVVGYPMQKALTN